MIEIYHKSKLIVLKLFLPLKHRSVKEHVQEFGMPAAQMTNHVLNHRSQSLPFQLNYVILVVVEVQKVSKLLLALISLALGSFFINCLLNRNFSAEERI